MSPSASTKIANTSRAEVSSLPAMCAELTAAVGRDDFDAARGALRKIVDFRHEDSYTRRETLGALYQQIVDAAYLKLVPSTAPATGSLGKGANPERDAVASFLVDSLLEVKRGLFVEKDIARGTLCRAVYLVLHHASKIDNEFLATVDFLNSAMHPSARWVLEDSRRVTRLSKKLEEIGVGKLIRGEDGTVSLSARALVGLACKAYAVPIPSLAIAESDGEGQVAHHDPNYYSLQISPRFAKILQEPDHAPACLYVLLHETRHAIQTILWSNLIQYRGGVFQPLIPSTSKHEFLAKHPDFVEQVGISKWFVQIHKSIPHTFIERDADDFAEAVCTQLLGGRRFSRADALDVYAHIERQQQRLLSLPVHFGRREETQLVLPSARKSDQEAHAVEDVRDQELETVAEQTEAVPEVERGSSATRRHPLQLQSNIRELVGQLIEGRAEFHTRPMRELLAVIRAKLEGPTISLGQVHIRRALDDVAQALENRSEVQGPLRVVLRDIRRKLSKHLDATSSMQAPRANAEDRISLRAILRHSWQQPPPVAQLVRGRDLGEQIRLLAAALEGGNGRNVAIELLRVEQVLHTPLFGRGFLPALRRELSTFNQKLRALNLSEAEHAGLRRMSARVGRLAKRL
ncbi:MAG: hypothetical protein K1X79_01755 [Oligoflexia bacterium]|nr:hypothetical protein [Oligoflexia bacterium]